ncbi:MAG: hypothetical protein IPM38_19380 [Ignavibacteria bacterium]|nr:hypothetical protein [Ignavibacteria bacterium]
MGNLDAARNSYQKVLEIEPTNTSAKEDLELLDKKQ